MTHAPSALTPNLIDVAAGQLLRAFEDGTDIDDLAPDCRPQSLADARRIQDALVNKLGGHGGWKVGQLQPDREPGCAPLPARRIMHSPAAWSFSASGPLEVEVEVAVLIGQDLTQAGALDLATVRAAVASLHPALEVVSSRLRHRQSLPALTALCDLQANAGLVLGPPTESWTTIDLAHLAMTLFIDGQVAAQTEAGPAQDRMLAALTWLANHARERGKPLRRGDLVLTGARILATPLPHGARIQARVQDLGGVELST
jgi:2-keto-4-pentenoate hydratase